MQQITMATNDARQQGEQTTRALAEQVRAAADVRTSAVNVAQQIGLITRANREQSKNSADMLQVLSDVRKIADQELRTAAEISTLSTALVDRARTLGQGGAGALQA